MRKNEKVDCRILTLEKWDIPKTTTIKNHLQEHNDVYTQMFMSFNYFDFVNVSSCEFDKVYEVITEIKEAKSDDTHIQQNIIIFTEDEEERIKNFWSSKCDNVSTESSLTYFTMIKFIYPDLDVEYDYVSLYNDIVQEIQDLFHDNNVNNEDFLIYSTLDFSDIVIVSHNISIEKYQKLLWSINFHLHKQDKYGKGRYIKDSITLYGIDTNLYLSALNNIEKGTISTSYVERFNISVRLSLQDENILFELLKDISDIVSGKYSMFGRYDVLIFIENIDLYKVISIQEKIDLLIEQSEDKINHVFNAVKFDFSTPLDLSVSSKKTSLDKSISTFYSIAKDYLSNLSIRYDESMKKKQIMDYLSIYEIKRAIIEILKNGFSEDFSLCIILPLIRFMQYSINRPPEAEEREFFYQLHKEFFENISLLTHCTMHNDRQFIQTPSFNAVVTDVPPKLLSFYNAVAYYITDLLTDDEEKNNNQHFAFMFAPDFRGQIHVAAISHGKDTDDRIFTIYINEELLYKPHRVVTVLSHEIAHYVGSETRNRIERVKYIFESCIYALIDMKYDDLFLELVSSVADCISEQLFWFFESYFTNRTTERIGYLSQIKFFLNFSQYFRVVLGNRQFHKKISSLVIERLEYNPERKKSLITNGLDYSSKILNGEYLSNIDNEDYQIKVIIDFILKEITKASEFVDLKKENLHREILSTFSEAYADLVMIRTLDLNYQEYLQILQSEENYEGKFDCDKLLLNNSIESLSTVIRTSSVLRANFKMDNKSVSEIINKDNFSKSLSAKAAALIENCVCKYLSLCIESIDNKPYPIEKIKELRWIRLAAKELNIENFCKLRDFTFKFRKEIINLMNEDIHID